MGMLTARNSQKSRGKSRTEQKYESFEIKLDVNAYILTGEVTHQRLSPKRHGFRYPIYYLSLPLHKLDQIKNSKLLAIDRAALMSFHRRDHGARRNNENLETWAKYQLAQFGLAEKIDRICLISMPRILGFVFNPVSFWLCFDKQSELRGVIYEVDNTYGETHSYVCACQNGGIINPKDWITARKQFHVSPFLPRNGSYQFRIDQQGNDLKIWINYIADDGTPTLSTALKGTLTKLDKQHCRQVFWRYPLITYKAIALIYLHALKLKLKGLKFHNLPSQKDLRLSSSLEVTKK